MPPAPEQPWQRDHAFGQHEKKPGEARTLVVIVVTAVTMLVEISAGIAFGSMALLADGLHMASHAAALGIAFFAYVYARRHAHDERYSFGTGKVNSLAGFSGAVILALFAVMMAWESVARLVEPVAIRFNQALIVAVLGLVVNGVSVFILGHGGGEDGGDHAGHDNHHHDDDHNLRSAYFHVLADALTSVLAIAALLSGKYFGWVWMDPVIGILGALLVGRWSVSLARVTSAVLLDRQAPPVVCDAVRKSIESAEDCKVADLHVWIVAPNTYAAIVSVVTPEPKPPDHYRRMLPDDLPLEHVTVEVWQQRPSP